MELAQQSFDPRYVDLQPGLNPYMVDTLAEAYFVSGDVEKAIRIERALIKEGVGAVDYFGRQSNRFAAAQREMQAGRPGR